jgi:hypothetical protein
MENNRIPKQITAYKLCGKDKFRTTDERASKL